MLLDIEMKKDTLFVRPNGELDLGVADQLRRTWTKQLKRARPKTW
ncbi:MAG: hypothetical protein RQM92_06615 [Candidatus Syntrophopropionicum ammoniitolerans]